jgi:hypothetical protein
MYKFEWLQSYWCKKNAVFLLFHVLYLFNMMHYPYAVQVRPWADSQAKS